MKKWVWGFTHIFVRKMHFETFIIVDTIFGHDPVRSRGRSQK
jgi:hypothetical protein